jgi:hypothetical protein
MKLALYLPNFRDLVTVKELEDLTSLAEELDFDSVWTLDRIVVPEASDRVELQYSFGMMDEFPRGLPVSSQGEFLQGMPLLLGEVRQLLIGFLGQIQDCAHGVCCPPLPQRERSDRHLVAPPVFTTLRPVSERFT